MTQKAENMKKYLKAVLEAELSCYTYDCAIARFTKEKKKYERRPIVYKPRLQNDELSGSDFGAMLIVFLIAGVIGLIITGIFIGMIFDSIKTKVDTDFILFLLFGIPVAIGIISVVVINHKDSSSVKEHNQAEMDRYNRELALANKQIAEDNIIIQRLEAQINQLVYGRSLAKKQLASLYGLNIIHRDYRELTKISKMYEYFDIGICDSLEGGLGAYAKCREEMIWGSMYDLLVEIKNDISELKGICYSLYEGVTESNKRLEQLNHGMKESLSLAERTANNSAISAYNSEIAANEARIQTDMMIYTALIH